MKKKDLKSLPLDELTTYMTSLGQPSYRASQLYRWMHVSLADSFDAMTNLPKELREQLRSGCKFTVLKQADVQVSRQDGTRKYLFELGDGNLVESVLMQYRHGWSVCISSQVGCRMGCVFCASTIGGLVRNLSPAEMLEQVYRIQMDIGERITNVVVMGTGEPLDNLTNLLTFIRMISDGNGLNISQRNITVSTCGQATKIKELAKEKLAITLALSLHAPDQATRERLMPIAKSNPLFKVMEACDYYYQQTGRRITLEYCLVSGVNDDAKSAAALAKLIGRVGYHVNLIPVNPIKERGLKAPNPYTVAGFKNKLEKYGINVTIRREMGRDIDGACGQLRRRFSERQDEET
ncbi:MAG: 23S rRNA (adenine(2503)-C(2))-methyltransferase RlmN [Clostridiales bacterium]|nr:23S rRNA (adenine(2503)-C(2))-methyltransferase RlmN [Clostridiales bacterium]